MRKTLILLILAFGLLNFDNPNGEKINEKLTDTQLNFLIKSYSWGTEDLLIVNFNQPKSRCHYDNYVNLKKSINWWNRFYSKIELQSAKNIFVYADNLRAAKVIDSKTYFADKNFFFKNFFSDNTTCYGLLIIKKNGEYQKKSGEYTQEHIVELINNLYK
jgi:hypothetical protein